MAAGGGNQVRREGGGDFVAKGGEVVGCQLGVGEVAGRQHTELDTARSGNMPAVEPLATLEPRCMGQVGRYGSGVHSSGRRGRTVRRVGWGGVRRRRGDTQGATIVNDLYERKPCNLNDYL